MFFRVHLWLHSCVYLWAVIWGAGLTMKQTTFEEFVELARRGTFVPVVKEIMTEGGHG